MEVRRLGSLGLAVSQIGFGAFKIGRNLKVNYSKHYDLPDSSTANRLLNEVLDLGITYIDTAPAYGASEERIGQAISHRRSEFTLSSKVGERFHRGRSTYDFSSAAIKRSVTESLQRLRTDVLDVLFLHSNGEDIQILHQTTAVDTLLKLKSQGLVRGIGLSGKTVEGASAALEWADAIMIEYHLLDQSHECLAAEAAARGIGVIVKKPLASGRLPADTAIRFIAGNPSISTMVIGTVESEHLRANIASCAKCQCR